MAQRGDEALQLARQFFPTAVSLDVFLPDMLGWTVLSQLKQDPLTRHIPVQLLTSDEDRQHGLARGAFSFVTKPTTSDGLAEALGRIKDYAGPRRKRLLVIEDNSAEQMSIRELLGHDDIDILTAETGTDGAGHDGPDRLRLRRPRPAPARHVRLRGAPAHGRSMTSGATCRSWSSRAASCRPTKRPNFSGHARSVVVKGVQSPERLLDETALFLHRVVSTLPDTQAGDDRAPPPVRRGPRRQERCSSSMTTCGIFSR